MDRGRSVRVALLCPMLYVWIELFGQDLFDKGNRRQIHDDLA